MKIILIEDVKGSGRKHDIIDVKDGFARFLIATKKAIFVTELSLKKQQTFQAQQKAIDDKRLKEAQALKTKIEALKLSFSLKANEDQAFGTITTKAIADCLAAEHNIAVDKFMFIDNKKSYQLGKHVVKIKLDKEVIASLTIDVKKEK